MNADDVQTLVRIWTEDIENLKKKIEAMKTSCTHVFANGRTALIQDVCVVCERTAK